MGCLLLSVPPDFASCTLQSAYLVGTQFGLCSLGGSIPYQNIMSLSASGHGLALPSMPSETDVVVPAFLSLMLPGNSFPSFLHVITYVVILNWPHSSVGQKVCSLGRENRSVRTFVPSTKVCSGARKFVISQEVCSVV